MKHDEIWWTQKLVREARNAGFYATRMELIHEPGFPDVFIAGLRRNFFIELKMEGEDFTPAQKGWWANNAKIVKPYLLKIAVDNTLFFSNRAWGKEFDSIKDLLEDLTSVS